MKSPASLIGFILLYTVSAFSPAEEVTVAVASNFTTVAKALASQFEKETEHRVRLVFGSSGKIYAQIKNKAPFDLFFSADQAKPIALEKDGLAVPGSRFSYAVGSLVLWSADPQKEVGEEVLKHGDNFNKLALANPRLAPYGVAAVEVLENLGLLQATEFKWVRGENIAQTYQFIGTGNAELGFVALSQVMENGRISRGKAWIIPEHLYQPIRQDAVLLEAGKQNAAAREFLQFVRKPKSRAIIESFGYRTEGNSKK